MNYAVAVRLGSLTYEVAVRLESLTYEFAVRLESLTYEIAVGLESPTYQVGRAGGREQRSCRRAGKPDLLDCDHNRLLNSKRAIVTESCRSSWVVASIWH